MVVEAPVPRLPFQDSLVAVTSLPVWLQLADQPWVTRWLLVGKVHLSVQPLTGSPRFLMVTFAVKPLLPVVGRVDHVAGGRGLCGAGRQGHPADGEQRGGGDRHAAASCQ